MLEDPLKIKNIYIYNKLSFLYRYGEDFIKVVGRSVCTGAYLGISWKGPGLDIRLILAGIITASFRIDIDSLKWLGSF